MRLAHQDDLADASVLASVIEQSRRAVGAAVQRLPYPTNPAFAAAVVETENAWRAVAAEFGLLSAAEVGELLGSNGRRGSLANDQRLAGKLLGVRRGHQYRYPGFQFDPARGRTCPGFAVVVSTARAAGVPDDDLALWLCAPSGRVDGDRPVDHLHEPERVAAAVRDHFTAEW